MMRIANTCFRFLAYVLIGYTVFVMDPDMPIWGDSGYIDYHGHTIWNEPKTLSHFLKANNFSDPIVIPSCIALVSLYITAVLILASFIISAAAVIREKNYCFFLDVLLFALIAVAGAVATVYFCQVMNHENPVSMVYSVFPAIAAVFCAIPLILRLAMRKKEN